MKRTAAPNNSFKRTFGLVIRLTSTLRCVNVAELAAYHQVRIEPVVLSGFHRLVSAQEDFMGISKVILLVGHLFRDNLPHTPFHLDSPAV